MLISSSQPTGPRPQGEERMHSNLLPRQNEMGLSNATWGMPAFVLEEGLETL